jgi:hypothetical protein
MTPLFKKLNYKNQSPIWIINSPESFKNELDEIARFTEVKTNLPVGSDKPDFILTFAVMKQELDKLSEAVLPYLQKETVLWFAYPKGTSKKYKSDYNRDKGWDVITKERYGGVRMISIDDDWSALRFKKK